MAEADKIKKLYSARIRKFDEKIAELREQQDEIEDKIEFLNGQRLRVSVAGGKLLAELKKD